MNIKVKNHFNIENFNGFNLLLRHDSVASTFSFSFYFEPKNRAHKILFQVGHYHQLSIYHNGELLLTGWMLNQKFVDSSVKTLAVISGYSLPGVIEDCNIPLSLYPLQFDGQTLKEIGQKLVSVFPFNFNVDSIVSSKANEVYPETTASESDTIKSYLTSLATQKDIILTHTNDGNLLLTKSKTNRSPIYHFDKNIPGIKMTLNFNGQAMHSEITVFKEADVDDGNAGQETVKNPFVPFVLRPLVRTQSSGNDIDTSDAARAVLANEIKNVTLKIETSVWEIDGEVIKPNNIITVINEDIYLYEKNKWFIESVNLVGNENQTTAVLNCVLPEVYSGETPKYIFEYNEDGEHS